MDLGTVLILATGAVGALLVLLGALGLHMAWSTTQVHFEAPESPRPKTRTEQTFILHRFTETLGRPLGKAVHDTLTDRRRTSIRRRIEIAGQPDGLTVQRYTRRKAGEVMLYGSGALLLYVNGSVLLAVIVLAFAALTDIDLYVRAQERQDRIQSQLPDFLDVLAVTVGAGMSFRGALERVAASMPGLLADEFRLALRHMELGTPRREAFENLRRRNRNESLAKFVTAIQQAEELGSPLTQALVEISQDMRRQDAQYMRRKAQRVNPRVTAVTAATMLPGLLILIVGSLFLGSDVDLGVILGG